MCYLPKDERWQDGVTQALSEKLGIHESMQREGLHISEAAHHSEEYRGMPGYPWAIHGLSMGQQPFYNQIMHQKVTTSLCFNRFVMFTDSVDVVNWSGNRNLPLTPAQFSAILCQLYKGRSKSTL